MGRPSEYSPEKAREICERMAEGKSLREICLAEDMPSKTTVFRWLEREEPFRDQYARAREAQFDFIAEEIVRISDDASGDFFIEDRDGKSVVVPDHARVQRDRLRVDSRKWLLSKIAPRKYGDKVDGGGLPEEAQRITQITLVGMRAEPESTTQYRETKTLQLTYQPQPLPADLPPEDWRLMLQVLDTIKGAMAAGRAASPGEVFGVIAAALETHFQSSPS